MASSALKRKFIFNTSGLLFCKSILDEVRDNCEILVTPLVDGEFSKKETGYSVEEPNDDDKKRVYEMIRRYRDKESAINYRKGRKTFHAGEFELIALAKRLGIPIVIHDNRARQWAKWEHVESLHPIELPDTFRHKLTREKLIEFLTFHCKMKYAPACEKLRELQEARKILDQ